MNKKFPLDFPGARPFLDALTVAACWMGAYYIRFDILPGALDYPEKFFLKMIPVPVLITALIFYRHGLYKELGSFSINQDILRVTWANTLSTATLVLVLYFFGRERLSRVSLGIFYLLSTLAFILGRICLHNITIYFRKSGRGLTRVLLVGNGPPLGKYIQAIQMHEHAGLHPVGWLDSEGEAKKYGIEEITESYEKFKKRTPLDFVVLSYTGEKSEKSAAFITSHYNDVVPLKVLPDLSHSLLGHRIEEFGGVPILSINAPSLGTGSLFLKRCMDIFLTAPGLVFLSPLLLLIGALVKITSRGSVFYGQRRVGLKGEEFTMWKFRSMREARTGEDETSWGSKENTRKTPFGSLLRKTSLDELPQLWNVLKGEMSLIGPRPERPFFVDKFRKEIPGYMLRHSVKPGISGKAQISGWRGDTSIEKRIECDIDYIKNWSLWLDVKILFLTFFRGMIHKNAY